jgi:putative transposase
MPDYRRNRVPGGTDFFTVNLLDRRSDLLVTQIDILRAAVRRVRARASFRIDAWVVLPDHMHCLSTLPPGDADFPGRWRAIKTAFVKGLPAGESRSRVMTRRGGTGHLAAPLLGARDPGRSRLCGSHGLHAFQPGQTRSRRAPGALAIFVVSPVCRGRPVSRQMAWRQRRTARSGRAALRPERGNKRRDRQRLEDREFQRCGGGGMRCAFPPYACCGAAVAGYHDRLRTSASEALP